MLLARASLGTVVQVHGDGMAPTILHGDTVLVVRGAYGVEVGDIVVYEVPRAPDLDAEPLRAPPPQGDRAGDPEHRAPDVDRDMAPARPLRDTAVVDPEQVDENWSRLQGDDAPARTFRVGRVLAIPGQRLEFGDADAALGLVVDGEALSQKSTEPMRLVLQGEPVPGEDLDEVAKPKLHAVAYESRGNTRYPVLISLDETTWPGMALPSSLGGPAELVADGYLIVSDNRDAGRCCDSRALGLVPADNLRGEVVMRLAANPHATPDVDPSSRRLQWLPLRR